LAGIYSTRFVAVAPTVTNTVYYTVPAGKIAVIRSMTVAWSATARAGGTVYVLLPLSNGYLWVVNIPGGSPGSDRWEGRTVLNPGETIRASTTSSPVTFLTVSGYLLNQL
jgi:hypothetical protein